MTYSKAIKDSYKDLCSPPEDADKEWFQKRGYRFERLLNEILVADELDPRTGYKPKGEQIDGSFFLEGQVFLLEAKWHKAPAPASMLYQFKGKVDGKLVGTIGVFVSMGGYSADAVDALILGKSLNVILFDKSDIDAIIESGIRFRDVLRFKLRMAAEEGAVFYPAEVGCFTKNTSLAFQPMNLGAGLVTNGRLSRNPYIGGIDLFIICEGETDSLLLSGLAQKILWQLNIDKVINLVVANGKLTIPKIANALYALNDECLEILLVADSDGDVNKTMEFFQKEVGGSGWDAVIPDPNIEIWLSVDSSNIKRKPPLLRKRDISDWVNEVDINELKNRDQAFSRFYSIVAKPSNSAPLDAGTQLLVVG